MKRTQAEPVSERRLKVAAEAEALIHDVRKLRDDALDIVNVVRTEAAELHWYAHQFVTGKAGIDKDGALIEFGQASSEIGMALNHLAARVSALAALVESEAAQ